VIPVLIPGKNHSFTTSYRCISLTSCVCKVLECMVNCWARVDAGEPKPSL
jgi:hypothetical protein